MKNAILLTLACMAAFCLSNCQSPAGKQADQMAALETRIAALESKLAEQEQKSEKMMAKTQSSLAYLQFKGKWADFFDLPDFYGYYPDDLVVEPSPCLTDCISKERKAMSECDKISDPEVRYKCREAVKKETTQCLRSCRIPILRR